ESRKVHQAFRRGKQLIETKTERRHCLCPEVGGKDRRDTVLETPICQTYNICPTIFAAEARCEIGCQGFKPDMWLLHVQRHSNVLGRSSNCWAGGSQHHLRRFPPQGRIPCLNAVRTLLVDPEELLV